MLGIEIVTSVLVALATVGVDASAAEQRAGDRNLRADLERISKRRIFFGHQSVGENVLDGLRDLGRSAGVAARIDLVQTAASVKPGTLGHAFVAENRNPVGKLQAFAEAMAPRSAGVEIALLKFCYLDFTPGTDAKALFERYRSTVDGLRARNPGTTFVHVTAPLTDVEKGAKAFAKRLLGRAPYGFAENLRREEYNALLRQAYGGYEPIFDLARVESTAPDGSAVLAEWQGKTIPAMAAAYTDDGGHLNANGRMRAARELVSVLAAIPDRPGR